jgi:hypothetical protein
VRCWRQRIVARSVPVEDAVFAIGAVGGCAEVDTHAEPPWRGSHAGLGRGGTALNENSLAGAVDPLGGTGLENGQLTLQSLDVGCESVSGRVLPPSCEGSSSPDEEACRENDGAYREGELAGEAVSGSAYGGVRGMSGFDQVALHVLDGAGEVRLSSTQRRIDLLAIVYGVEGAHLVTQLGETGADSGQRLANGGGINCDGAGRFGGLLDQRTRLRWLAERPSEFRRFLW